MRTKLKDSPTKQKLLDAAEDLMLGKGYVATTVDEICGKARVTKGSFFHYFKSKEALGKELLERYNETRCRSIKDCLESRSEDPLEQIYGMLDTFIKASKDPKAKGCLIGTLAQEISETHPELRHCCEKNFEEAKEIFRSNLVRARAAHKPKVAFDVNSLADHFLAVMQGSLVLVKAKKDRKIFERNMIHLKGYLKCLFGK